MRHDNPDVLILSTGLGFGHHQASQAITEALIEQSPTIRAETVDFLSLLPPYLARGIPWGHQSLAKNWPSGYGMMYKTTSKMSQFRLWNMIEQRPGLKSLDLLLKEISPKLVIATHPMPLMSMSVLRGEGRFPGSALAIVTDYVVHPDWIRPNIDHYCVPTTEVRELLVKRGFDPTRITATGIPLRHAFHAPLDYEITRQKLGWDSAPRILFIVGSQGMRPRPAMDAIEQLTKLPQDVRLVVITAEDTALFRFLEQRVGDDDRLTILPYQKNIHEWMAGSDVVITKAGALTTSEVLSLGRPLIIFRPLPGQETGNTNWLMRSGAAIHCETPSGLYLAARNLLSDPGVPVRMTEAASQVARPLAAKLIAEVCLNTIAS